MIRDPVKNLAVLHKQPGRLVIGILDHLLYDLIDLCRRLLTTIEYRSAIQIMILYGFQTHHAEFVRHTVLCNHRTCDTCRHLNIIRSSARRRLEYQFLGGTACHIGTDLRQQFILCL